MPDPLLEGFEKHDRRALSRLLSLAARGQPIAGPLAKPQAASRVVAITGSGGVGKSTLIGKLIEKLRERGQTVAVLACDPESPLSGGALLGDRFRMPSRPEDEGVFIRSLAAASGHGALADHLPALIRLLEAFGFDIVVLETAGAGQGDTAVRELVDVVVLLLQPETGDDLQWEKAGLLEVADIVAIHKADLPGAEGAAAQVRAALDLAGVRPVPVLRVSAKTGEGIDELVGAVLGQPLRRSSVNAQTFDLLGAAQEALAARFAEAEATPELRDLLTAWQRGEIAAGTAGAEALRLLSQRSAPGSN
jgi:LAO/AO transport system kinase